MTVGGWGRGPGGAEIRYARNGGVAIAYQVGETKIEPELELIKEPSTGPKGKDQRVEKKPKQRVGRGSESTVKG